MGKTARRRSRRLPRVGKMCFAYVANRQDGCTITAMFEVKTGDADSGFSRQSERKMLGHCAQRKSVLAFGGNAPNATWQLEEILWGRG